MIIFKSKFKQSNKEIETQEEELSKKLNDTVVIVPYELDIVSIQSAIDIDKETKDRKKIEESLGIL